MGGTKRAIEKNRSVTLTSFLQSSVFERQAGAGLENLNSSPTKHIEADFFGLRACFVLGDAGVIAFIHFLHVLYRQFGAVLVQDVLLSRLKRDVVAAAEEGDDMSDDQPDGGPNSSVPCSSAPVAPQKQRPPPPSLPSPPRHRSHNHSRGQRSKTHSLWTTAALRREKSICIKRN